MIISHKYKYLFIESPNTGSTALSAELCANYDGMEILKKHSRYFEFLAAAGEQERKYFVFSSVRNPLDAQVSIFYKYKTNHRGRFTNPAELLINGGVVTKTDLRRFNYINENNLSYHGYLKKFLKMPYDTWNRLSHNKFDFIIRYENIQGDFKEVLKIIGIEQKRPLPVINKTAKDKSYLELFDPATYQLAANTFGPFMKKWGYSFPNEWGDVKPSSLANFKFEIIGLIKIVYWRMNPKSSRKRRIELQDEFRKRLLD